MDEAVRQKGAWRLFVLLADAVNLHVQPHRPEGGIDVCALFGRRGYVGVRAVVRDDDLDIVRAGRHGENQRDLVPIKRFQRPCPKRFRARHGNVITFGDEAAFPHRSPNGESVHLRQGVGHGPAQPQIAAGKPIRRTDRHHRQSIGELPVHIGLLGVGVRFITVGRPVAVGISVGRVETFVHLETVQKAVAVHVGVKGIESIFVFLFVGQIVPVRIQHRVRIVEFAVGLVFPVVFAIRVQSQTPPLQMPRRRRPQIRGFAQPSRDVQPLRVERHVRPVQQGVHRRVRGTGRHHQPDARRRRIGIRSRQSQRHRPIGIRHVGTSDKKEMPWHHPRSIRQRRHRFPTGSGRLDAETGQVHRPWSAAVQLNPLGVRRHGVFHGVQQHAAGRVRGVQPVQRVRSRRHFFAVRPSVSIRVGLVGIRPRGNLRPVRQPVSVRVGNRRIGVPHERLHPVVQPVPVRVHRFRRRVIANDAAIRRETGVHEHVGPRVAHSHGSKPFPGVIETCESRLDGMPRRVGPCHHHVFVIRVRHHVGIRGVQGSVGEHVHRGGVRPNQANAEFRGIGGEVAFRQNEMQPVRAWPVRPPRSSAIVQTIRIQPPRDFIPGRFIQRPVVLVHESAGQRHALRAVLGEIRRPAPQLGAIAVQNHRVRALPRHLHGHHPRPQLPIGHRSVPIGAELFPRRRPCPDMLNQLQVSRRHSAVLVPEDFRPFRQIFLAQHHGTVGVFGFRVVGVPRGERGHCPDHSRSKNNSPPSFLHLGTSCLPHPHTTPLAMSNAKRAGEREWLGPAPPLPRLNNCSRC